MSQKKMVERRLKELLDELIYSIKNASDPFKIDVSRYINELSKLFPYIEEQTLELDAEIIYELANIIRQQEEWLRDKSFLFMLGSLLAILKIKKLDARQLAEELINSWRPIVYEEQITFNEILRGVDYASRKIPILKHGLLEEATTISKDNLIFQDFVPKVLIDNIMRKIKKELDEKFKKNDLVEYDKVISVGSLREKYLRALALAFLVRRGIYAIYYDALEERIYIVKNCESSEFESIVTRVV